MSDEPVLSRAPLEHPALDYSQLRWEGLRYLEALVGRLWTDFNTHDPGITILEQLCYAITDLAYRADHDIPDLLASSGGDPYRSLYSAATILTSHPVTMLDLRKLILDIDGVSNAWIEPLAEPAPVLHARADEPSSRPEVRYRLGFQADPPYTTPVVASGRFRVVVETSDLLDRPVVEVQRDVARRLSACRPLCTDVDEIRVLAGQPIQVHAEIEIGPVDDAERVLVAIYEALAEQISPSVPFRTLGEMLATGRRSDEIFDGPALDHGFLDSGALERMRRKDAIRTSDLIHEIMSIPDVGIRAVRNIAVSAGGAREPWSLVLDPARTPRLDLQGSSIVLVKGRITARLDHARIIERVIERRRRATSRGKLSPGERDFTPPAGRDREIARYRSIQHELPALYGVGPAGLPEAATQKRRAQARQLKAYLMFFDQLLASAYAQLARAGSLFSFDDEDARTYFTQMVDDDELGLSDVRMFDAATHLAHLRASAEDSEAPGSLSSRKNRFLNHLIARFAEQFTDYSLVLFGAGQDAAAIDDRLIPDKRAFLQRYPRISSARGTGQDLLSPGAGISGLEERIERKLGLSAEQGERLVVIEHVLLAPIGDDQLSPDERYDREPLFLTEAVSRDPFSLQLSVVLPSWRGRLRQDSDEINELRLLVEHTVREETPAHLTPYVHWLDEARWHELARTHREWLDACRAHRAARLGLEAMDDPRHIRMRDARDRLIDLLGLGKTYPLRDLPIRHSHFTVPIHQPARIPIEGSQRGVMYELRGPDDVAVADAEGTGETVVLQTPPMLDVTTFRIVARKEAPRREVYLQQHVTVTVGLDVGLAARIVDAALLDPRLDPSIDRPADTDARIVEWGARVRVQIDRSQEGVDYRVVQIAPEREHTLSGDVRGNLGDIVATCEPVHEDLDLRIRATRVYEEPGGPKTETALLAIVLPLKVSARPDLAVTVQPSVVDHGASAAVRIDGTQDGADYTAFVGGVGDSVGWARGIDPAVAVHSRYVRVVEGELDAAAPALVAVDVGGARVHVLRPPRRAIWEDLDGFAQVGEPVNGNGGSIRLPLSALVHDSVILVRARKHHRHGAATHRSAVQLARAALIGVRPDPDPALELGVIMEGGAGGRTTGTVEVTGGQAGVLYQLRRTPDGADLGHAYVHQVDDRDPALNKGIDQPLAGAAPYGLEVGVDLAISRGTQRLAAGADLATTRPLAPVVDTGALEAGATLQVRAVKAQTGAAVALSRTARIAPVPAIDAPAVVPRGSAARVIVRASVAGERYQLARDAEPIGPARDGDGSDLVFATGPVSESARFQVLVTRPDDPGIPVRRAVEILVTVADS